MPKSPTIDHTALLANMFRALDQVGEVTKTLHPDVAGRSENRLYAEIGEFAGYMAAALSVDRAMSIALGQNLYAMARRMEDPTENDFAELGSLARFVGEQANAKLAALRTESPQQENNAAPEDM